MSTASQNFSSQRKPDECPRIEPKDIPPKVFDKRGKASEWTGWKDRKTGIIWCTKPGCDYCRDPEVNGRAKRDVTSHYRRIHLLRKQGRNLILCEFCDLRTKTAPDMKTHLEHVHTFGKDLEACTNYCGRSWFLEVKNAWKHTREYCPRRKMNPRPENLYSRNWSIEEKAFIPVPQKSPQAAPTSNGSSFNFNDPPTSTVSPLRTEPVPSQPLSRLPPGQHSFSVTPSQHSETSNNRDMASNANPRDSAASFVDFSRPNNGQLEAFDRSAPGLYSQLDYSKNSLHPSLSYEHKPQTPASLLFPQAAPSAVNPHQHFPLDTHFQGYGYGFHPSTQPHFDSHGFMPSPSNFGSVNSFLPSDPSAFQPTTRQSPLPLNALLHKPNHGPPSYSFNSQIPLQLDYPSSNIPDFQPNYAIFGFMTPSRDSQYFPLTPQSAHHSNSSPWPVVAQNSPYDQYQHLPVDSSPLTYYHQYHQM